MEPEYWVAVEFPAGQDPVDFEFGSLPNDPRFFRGRSAAILVTLTSGNDGSQTAWFSALNAARIAASDMTLECAPGRCRSYDLP
jgi:hypothetical protein